MPPAKKPAPRRRATTAKATSSHGPITRKEVEQATARFEKALDDAMNALQAMRNDFGKGANAAYKDVAATLRTLRATAKKSNRALLKDIEKLASSVTSAAKAPASTRSRAGAAKATASKRTTARSSAAKKAGTKTTSTRSASKTTRAGTARKSTAAKSTAAKRSTSRSTRAATK